MLKAPKEMLEARVKEINIVSFVLKIV